RPLAAALEDVVDDEIHRPGRDEDVAEVEDRPDDVLLDQWGQVEVRRVDECRDDAGIQGHEPPPFGEPLAGSERSWSPESCGGGESSLATSALAVEPPAR